MESDAHNNIYIAALLQQHHQEQLRQNSANDQLLQQKQKYERLLLQQQGMGSSSLGAIGGATSATAAATAISSSSCTPSTLTAAAAAAVTVHGSSAPAKASSSSDSNSDYDDIETEDASPESNSWMGQPFPYKLHKLLDLLEAKGLASIAGWNPDGRTFCIRQSKDFVTHIMTKFFKQSNFKSFQRQLNLYGFERVPSGPLQGSYFHRLFVRHQPSLCEHLCRKKHDMKSALLSSTSSPEQPSKTNSSATGMTDAVKIILLQRRLQQQQQQQQQQLLSAANLGNGCNNAFEGSITNTDSAPAFVNNNRSLIPSSNFASAAGSVNLPDLSLLQQMQNASNTRANNSMRDSFSMLSSQMPANNMVAGPNGQQQQQLALLIQNSRSPGIASSLPTSDNLTQQQLVLKLAYQQQQQQQRRQQQQALTRMISQPPVPAQFSSPQPVSPNLSSMTSNQTNTSKSFGSTTHISSTSQTPSTLNQQSTIDIDEGDNDSIGSIEDLSPLNATTEPCWQESDLPPAQKIMAGTTNAAPATRNVPFNNGLLSNTVANSVLSKRTSFNQQQANMGGQSAQQNNSFLPSMTIGPSSALTLNMRGGTSFTLAQNAPPSASDEQGTSMLDGVMVAEV